MSLVAVEAAITLADASRRQELLASTVDNQRATRDDEPGCLTYCFAADPVHEDLIQVYELWESEESLAAHLVHPNYFAMRKLLAKGGIASVVDRKHLITKSAPVYGPDLVASASFD
jgi:quinol monooxygenase YgiN